MTVPPITDADLPMTRAAAVDLLTEFARRMERLAKVMREREGHDPKWVTLYTRRAAAIRLVLHLTEE